MADSRLGRYRLGSIVHPRSEDSFILQLDLPERIAGAGATKLRIIGRSSQDLEYARWDGALEYLWKAETAAECRCDGIERMKTTAKSVFDSGIGEFLVGQPGSGWLAFLSGGVEIVVPIMPLREAKYFVGNMAQYIQMNCLVITLFDELFSLSEQFQASLQDAASGSLPTFIRLFVCFSNRT